MEIVIQYFDSCPSWETARDNVTAATSTLGVGAVVTFAKVESSEEAERMRFRGSPSILVDGRDLFPSEHGPIGMSCRVYLVDGHSAGSPSQAQIIEALRHRTSMQPSTAPAVFSRNSSPGM